MEPDTKTIVQNNVTNPLFQITPLSKYFALFLFIVLPFIGGLIGYKFGVDAKIGSTHQASLETGVPSEDIVQNDAPQELKVNSEIQNDNVLGTFRDTTFGVIFKYPNSETGLIQDPASATSGEIALIETVINGEPQFSRIPTNIEIPEEFSILRSYFYEVDSLDSFTFGNKSSGFAYIYNATRQEILCTSTIAIVNGYNPCAEVGEVKVGKTNLGLDIYKFQSGDGGYARKSFVVVLPEKGAVISFSTYMHEYYDDWLSGPELDLLVEDIIKTVE